MREGEGRGGEEGGITSVVRNVKGRPAGEEGDVMADSFRFVSFRVFSALRTAYIHTYIYLHVRV